MASNTEEISDLARRATAGDRSALFTLCQEYETEVRIAARVHLGPLLRPHLDSFDVAQSVHKSIIGRLMAGKIVVDDSARLIALACLIARRKIAKSWRKHCRQRRHDDISGPASDSVSNLNSVEGPGGGVSQIDDILSFDESLKGSERKIIELKLSGYTSDEIASILSIDSVAVRVRWSRLCAKIRERDREASG